MLATEGEAAHDAHCANRRASESRRRGQEATAGVRRAGQRPRVRQPGLVGSGHRRGEKAARLGRAAVDDGRNPGVPGLAGGRMSRYTVTWLKEVEGDLARLWMGSPDRPAVATAA